jgi:hypothetical protein
MAQILQKIEKKYELKHYIKMKTLIITSVWLIIGLTLFSQQPTIEYTYDAAGNRTHRDVIYIGEKKDNNKTGQSEKLSWSDKIGEHNIVIYPNPVKEKLTVEIGDIDNAAISQSLTGARMEIYSASGEWIYEDQKLKSKNTIDFSGMQSGTYMLKITLGGKSSVWKIIKE